MATHLAPDAGAKFGWEGMRDVPAFTSHDPATAGWERRRDDPNIQQRRAHLEKNAGIKGLDICSPEEVDRIVTIFLRDGFAAVKDIMDESQLARIQQASTDLIAERIAATPDGVTRTADQEGKPLWDEATGEWKEMPIRQPGRYSFGSHGNLHRPEWCMLADLPRLSTILEAIFQSKDYMCWGAGGDFALPGTMEYQNLPSDIGPGDFIDQTGRVELWDLPPMAVTCNFPMVDFSWENGAIRQIPGTQNKREGPPGPYEEPEWMRLSHVVGLKAGGVIIRDLRCWHGGTPNLSEHVRAIPNCEFHAPWYCESPRPPPALILAAGNDGRMQKTMPYERWQELSEHGKHVCRHVVCDEGEVPPQLRGGKL